MSEYLLNFCKALNHYGIMGCDIIGCYCRTKTGNEILEYIIGDPEKFRPIGLDVIMEYEEIDQNPRKGERAGAFAGCILGIGLCLGSLGTIPATFLVYDIARSFYLNNKESKK